MCVYFTAIGALDAHKIPHTTIGNQRAQSRDRRADDDATATVYWWWGSRHAHRLDVYCSFCDVNVLNSTELVIVSCFIVTSKILQNRFTATKRERYNGELEHSGSF